MLYSINFKFVNTICT